MAVLNISTGLRLEWKLKFWWMITFCYNTLKAFAIKKPRIAKIWPLYLKINKLNCNHGPFIKMTRIFLSKAWPSQNMNCAFLIWDWIPDRIFVIHYLRRNLIYCVFINSTCCDVITLSKSFSFLLWDKYLAGNHNRFNLDIPEDLFIQLL